jgi:RluA family pseudouridine synthase
MKPDPRKKIPLKHQPAGYFILYEDRDVIVGNKEAGFLTVSALWNTDKTIHNAVTRYVRKGNPKNRHLAYVVHRLDQLTTGILMFAKSEQALNFLKDNWKTTTKTYLAIVMGKMKNKSGVIESYLEEDEDYVVHSNQDANGKLARTEYEVLAENGKFSLLKINLLTGRKNQIRVHLAGEGNPIAGDTKYGRFEGKKKRPLALHSASIEFTHPHSRERILVEAPPPEYFRKLIDHPLLRSR